MSDRKRSDAETIAAIAELIGVSSRDARKIETVIDTAVEATIVALANPDMSRREIARLLGRRRPTVSRVVGRVREAEASGFPDAARGGAQVRLPWRRSHSIEDDADAPNGETT
jgi:Bacterial regulatory proteins, crp family